VDVLPEGPDGGPDRPANRGSDRRIVPHDRTHGRPTGSANAAAQGPVWCRRQIGAACGGPAPDDRQQGTRACPRVLLPEPWCDRLLAGGEPVEGPVVMAGGDGGVLRRVARFDPR
jgi:hypothetical protein